MSYKHTGFRRKKRGFSNGKRGFGFKNRRIDVSRYINKDVTITETVTIVPQHNFIDFLIDKKLKETIVKKGYVTPTPIQDQAIPHVLTGVDVVGIANTGTGKTAAFLIPLIDKVIKNNQEKVLIVVPTRELAFQINEEFRGFTNGLKLFSSCLVGGAHIGKQISQLRRPNNFIIGTPGRIKDLIERGVLNLKLFNTIVLDEADRMLDMGFIDDMKFMIAKMPESRQTLFFSATISSQIEKLINDFMKEPVRVSVKTGDTAKNIEQDVVKIKAGDSKIDVLHGLLCQTGFEKVLVFGQTKIGVEKICQALEAKGVRSLSIHGDKNLSQRRKALDDFKNNRGKVLVATDVAARGLDIDNVSHVINFDIPATHEDYVHRIGRTGRGDKKGKALTFID